VHASFRLLLLFFAFQVPIARAAFWLEALDVSRVGRVQRCGVPAMRQQKWENYSCAEALEHFKRFRLSDLLDHGMSSGRPGVVPFPGAADDCCKCRSDKSNFSAGKGKEAP